MSHTCPAPLDLRDLIAYERGETTPDDADRIEAHYFACAPCTRALETIQLLGRGIDQLAQTSLVSNSVPAPFVERLEQSGYTLRTYRLAPGDLVPCTAAPDDDFVIVRLHVGPLAETETVDIAATIHQPLTNTTHTIRRDDVIVDRATGELICISSGAAIRALPRTHWSMQAHIRGPDGERQLGPFTMNHTPWQDLPTPQ